MKRVKVQIGRSINIGNYESVRIDYGLEMDVTDDGKLAQAFKKATKAVEDLVNKKAKEIEDAINQ